MFVFLLIVKWCFLLPQWLFEFIRVNYSSSSLLPSIRTKLLSGEVQILSDRQKSIFFSVRATEENLCLENKRLANLVFYALGESARSSKKIKRTLSKRWALFVLRVTTDRIAHAVYNARKAQENCETGFAPHFWPRVCAAGEFGKRSRKVLILWRMH